MELKPKIKVVYKSVGCFVRKILSATEAKLAFKTGVAAGLSLIVGFAFSDAFDRPDVFVSGLWCVMASIVVMQAHLGGTYGAAWKRFLGVLIGSIAGVLFYSFWGNGPLSLACSVFCTIVICALLNIKDSFRIAGMSTAIIIVMAGFHPTVNPMMFSFYRFIDSCIGIIVAVVVARIVWPEKATENIQANIVKTLNLLSKYYRITTTLDPFTDAQVQSADMILEDIEELFQENRDCLEEAILERFDNQLKSEHWILIIEQLENICYAISALRGVHKEVLTKIFDDELAARVAELIDKTDVAFQSLEKSISSDMQSVSFESLTHALNAMNEDLVRFRATRTTRKFNLEDVESFFVFFYSLRSIGEAIIKTEKQKNECLAVS